MMSRMSVNCAILVDDLTDFAIIVLDVNGKVLT